MVNKYLIYAYVSLLLIGLTSEIYSQSYSNKTKVLVLGTPHLNQIKEFEPSMLEGTIEILTKEPFDAVAIENMPAELLYDIRSRKDEAFDGVLSAFGGERLSRADTVQQLLDFSFNDARKKFQELSDKKNLSDHDHMLMIEYALAIADPASATLHFNYLVDKSLIEQSKLDEAVFEDLQNNTTEANEIYSLALNLSQQFKLNKIEYIDNFQDEALLFKYFPEFINDYTKNQEKLKDISSLPVFTKANDLLEKSIKKKDLTDYYRYWNSDEVMAQDYEAQWSIWLKTNFPSGSDKARYYLWEMRNLQIAANIMKVSAFYPGKRILVIIGASHKSFIEKYLSQISDIELLDFQ